MSVNLFFGSFLNYLYNDIVTHLPIHWLRVNFLRIFNKKIHPTAKILMHTKILNFWKVEIQERVVINQYCLLDCRKYKIVLNNDTDIGPFTKIWTSGHKPDDPNHALYGGDVIIENHVWIASSVTILPNLIIKQGAVVAANSVVHKSIAEKNIVAGNPAKFLKLRNNDLKYKLNFEPIFS